MIRISLPVNPEEHVAFAYSPLLECVLSLHVLLEPKHHALQHSWVRKMRAIDPALKRRIEAYGFVYRHTFPDLFLPGPRDRAETFEEELDRICRCRPALLAEGFGRPLFDHGGRYGERSLEDSTVREKMLERAAAHGEPSRRQAQLLLDDPVEFSRQFAALLSDYWQTAFAREWERVEPLLADSVVESGRVLARRGIWPILGRLPPHCRVDPRRRELQIDLPHEHAVTISDEDPLVLSPSVFVWPHLRVNCDAPWPTALVYTAPLVARDAAPRIPPSDLLEVLRALGDDTRLRVLKLIAERPRTTQELAPLVGLSMTGLSKCLRRLAEAGLISARREGYYVVYRLEPSRLDAVSTSITDFLDPDARDSASG